MYQEKSGNPASNCNSSVGIFEGQIFEAAEICIVKKPEIRFRKSGYGNPVPEIPLTIPPEAASRNVAW
jgi:hypothetical protein